MLNYSIELENAPPSRAMEGSSNFLLWDVRTICGCNLKLADCCRTQVKKGYKGLSENLLLHKKNLGLKKKFCHDKIFFSFIHYFFLWKPSSKTNCH